MSASEQVARAAQAEILTEKTLRYKRNILLLAIAIAIGERFRDEIRLDKLEVFNVGIPENIAISVLWLATLYNVLFALMYGWRDWSHWGANLTRFDFKISAMRQTDFFPEVRMFFGIAPSSPRIIEQRWSTGIFKGWGKLKCFPDKDWCVFQARVKLADDPSKEKYETAFQIPKKTIKTVRRQIYYFLGNELLLPAGAIAIAIWMSL